MTAKNPDKPNTVKVELAYAWTDPDGKVHPADAALTLDPDTARALIRDGQARPADTTNPKE